MSGKHLARAVKLAGGQAALARALSERLGRSYKQQNVWNWLYREVSILPAEVVIPIEQIVGGKVTRHQLRPDIYPSESRAPRLPKPQLDTAGSAAGTRRASNE
jgi:DNA-binding transcriptional regulator YdaS (Cro superfamily)